jgi:hypothetical protein
MSVLSSAFDLPQQEEIELFGADGEDSVYRTLKKNFDCVIRNVAVPHNDLFLEKDFLVIEEGIPFVLEIKNWKGEITTDGKSFYQDKDNGVQKKMHSPVITTNQFIRTMKSFYQIKGPIFGAVVCAEPHCRLFLPNEMDGIALLPVKKMVSFIKEQAKAAKSQAIEPLDPRRILRCTRFYNSKTEFSKGILADNTLECTNEAGDRVRLDTTRLRYITVVHQTLRRQNKLYVTFENGKSGVFYQPDDILTVACLDGNFLKISTGHIKHIVF